MAQGEVVFLGFFKFALFTPAALARLLLAVARTAEPLAGDSSFDFRLLSDLGTKKAVGDVDGVTLVAEELTEVLEVLPFVPPFLNLL